MFAKVERLSDVQHDSTAVRPLTQVWRKDAIKNYWMKEPPLCVDLGEYPPTQFEHQDEK